MGKKHLLSFRTRRELSKHEAVQRAKARAASDQARHDEALDHAGDPHWEFKPGPLGIGGKWVPKK